MVVRAIVLLLLSTAAFADWTDTDDKTFLFEASFEGEALRGEFKTFSVSYAPETPQLVVEVTLSDADFGDPDMNAVLFDDAWFGTAYTTAIYRSTEIRDEGDGRFVATGTLSLKGVEAEVTVPFTWEESGDTARMRGEFTMDRTRFNVGSGEWSSGDSIGLKVLLEFDVALSR